MRAHRVLLAAVLCLLVVAGVHAQTPAPQKPPDVPFVPTPEPVVAKMLEMAKVTSKDVLYDLGSGDGRIVIAAAKRGARAVGIDIEPSLVQQARSNAQAAGVANLVKFIEGDIFDADIKEASVVSMYLLPDVNMRLRPKLLSDLKPGSRIVSHNYDLGDWAPAQKAVLTVNGVDHTVYSWVVPAGGRK